MENKQPEFDWSILVAFIIGMLMMGAIITTIEGVRLLRIRDHYGAMSRRMHREMMTDEK